MRFQNKNGKLPKSKRIALDGILTAVALIIFMVEQLIPLPFPVPGVKLGLSNVVTLFAVFAISPIDGGIILFVRIALGSLFAGQLSSFLYSLAGGVLCYGVTLLLYKIVTEKQIFVCGVFGAIMHNVGQICVAILLTGTPGIVTYLPVLVGFGVATGLTTGLIAQLLVIKLKKHTHSENESGDQ